MGAPYGNKNAAGPHKGYHGTTGLHGLHRISIFARTYIHRRQPNLKLLVRALRGTEKVKTQLLKVRTVQQTRGDLHFFKVPRLIGRTWVHKARKKR